MMLKINCQKEKMPFCVRFLFVFFLCACVCACTGVFMYVSACVCNVCGICA